MPASPDYETIPLTGNPAAWLYSAGLEQFIVKVVYSCYFPRKQLIPYFDRLRRFGYMSENLQRRYTLLLELIESLWRADPVIFLLCAYFRNTYNPSIPVELKRLELMQKGFYSRKSRLGNLFWIFRHEITAYVPKRLRASKRCFQIENFGLTKQHTARADLYWSTDSSNMSQEFPVLLKWQKQPNLSQILNRRSLHAWYCRIAAVYPPPGTPCSSDSRRSDLILSDSTSRQCCLLLNGLPGQCGSSLRLNNFVGFYAGWLWLISLN